MSRRTIRQTKSPKNPQINFLIKVRVQLNDFRNDTLEIVLIDGLINSMSLLFFFKRMQVIYKCIMVMESARLVIAIVT